MNKDKMLLELFLEREDLKNKIAEVKKELTQIISNHYAIGKPFNENVLKFNNKQLRYLDINLNRIKNSLEILEAEEKKVEEE